MRPSRHRTGAGFVFRREANQPTGSPAGSGAPASGQGAGLTSQGPNDPINPPTGGGTQQPTGGSADGGAPNGGGNDQSFEARLQRMETLMRNAAQERDQARQELQEERRKNLPPEELNRLKALDDQVKAAATREKNLILRYEIASRAPRLGIVDPELAVLLLERNNSVVVNDDGSVAGLDDALKALIKDRPHLVRATQQDIDAGAGTGGTRTPSGTKSMNDIIRGAARGQAIKG